MAPPLTVFILGLSCMFWVLRQSVLILSYGNGFSRAFNSRGRISYWVGWGSGRQHQLWDLIGRWKGDSFRCYGTNSIVTMETSPKGEHKAGFIFDLVYHSVDLRRMISVGSWSFYNCILLIHQLSKGENPKSVDFFNAEFLVYVH